MEYQLNRLQTTRLMGPMVDEHWASLRHAHEEGKKVCWTIGPLFILPMAMGLPTHFHAGYASYLAGRKGVVPLFQAAEAEGYLPEVCSYIRLHTGLIAAVKNNLPYREDIMISLPDLVVCSRYCQEQAHLADLIHRQLKVPIITVDLTPPQKESEFEERVRYVERQIREEAIPSLERAVGKRFDYDRLSEIVDILKKCATLRNECLDIAKSIPSPWTLIDMCVSIAPVMYLMGKPGTIEYYVKLKEELKERVAKKIPAVLPEEKYRLYWDNYIMWGWLGPLSRKVASYGGNMLVGRYPYLMFPHPESLDPENPIYSVADQLMRWMLPQGLPQFARKLLGQFVEDFSLDGLIMLSSPTCRLFDMGQQDILDEIERKYGIPGIIIEGDMVDPKFYSEAQLDTRLQALFEVIDGRRKMRRSTASA